jgi:hypothetical protein
VKRRQYLYDVDPLRAAYRESEMLCVKPKSFRSSLDADSSIQERTVEHEDGAPF